MGKLKKILWRILLVIIVLAIICTMAVLAINSSVKRSTEDDIVYVVQDKESTINTVSISGLQEFSADCILVLGAGIKDKETPSPMLKDRLDAGIALYKAGIAPKLLLSGDNGQVEHNEIHVMLNYCLKAGVPESDIFCDHAGFSTYDSMYRASSIFQVQRAIVVTQKYHEYRALYIGKKLGLSVIGVAAEQDQYFGEGYREFREVLARVKDWGKTLLRSAPLLGGEVIPISGSGISSHGE